MEEKYKKVTDYFNQSLWIVDYHLAFYFNRQCFSEFGISPQEAFVISSVTNIA